METLIIKNIAGKEKYFKTIAEMAKTMEKRKLITTEVAKELKEPTQTKELKTSIKTK